MARNGSGTYSNPYPNFISGTVISSSEVDANNSDIATALTQSIAVDGQSVVTGDIPLATHKFTAMKVGTAATDSLSLGQAQAEAFVWCGTAGGSADAITLSPSPAITAYAAGQRFVWMASGSTNTGATTVAISGLSTIALQDNGAALTAGQHAAGKMFMGILNTTSTVQIMQVQVSGTDPLIISSLTVTGDATIGDDLLLDSDSAVISLGDNQDVKITHVHDSGLTFKNTSTADDTPFVLLVQTGETDIALNDALGKIQFQAPDEAAGTDAILVAAEIAAVSEGDFSASNNATKLSFKTAASEAAAEKMSLSSAGDLTVSGDVITGDDVILDNDGGVVYFGDNQDVFLSHIHDSGLTFKNTSTGDDTPVLLLMQTGETDIAADDMLGRIQFQAPDEAAGTDAILVAAEIAAVSESDFSASNNATKLSFKTGASEAASEKMSLSSGGNLALGTDAAALKFGADEEVTLTHMHDSGLSMSAGANFTTLELVSTSASTNTGPLLRLQSDKGSPADDDYIGQIYFDGKNSAGEDVRYGSIYQQSLDVTDGTEDGRMAFYTMNNGTETLALNLTPTSIAITSDEIDINGTIVGTQTLRSRPVFEAGYAVGESSSGDMEYSYHNAGNLYMGRDSGGTYYQNSTRGIFIYDDDADSFVSVRVYDTSGSSPIWQHKVDGTIKSEIESNGDFLSATNSYGSTSDERLKEHIEDSGSQWNDVKSMRVRKYSFIADETDSPTQLGVIAQELEASGMSGLVKTNPCMKHSEEEGGDDEPVLDADGNPTDYKTVKYSVLYMKAVKALQEAMTRIETLETKVAALEST